MSIVKFLQLRNRRHPERYLQHWKVYVDNEEVGQFNLDVGSVYHLYLGPVFGQFKTAYEGPAFSAAAQEACRVYEKQFEDFQVTREP